MTTFRKPKAEDQARAKRLAAMSDRTCRIGLPVAGGLGVAMATYRKPKAEDQARSKRLAAIDREIPTGFAEILHVQLCRIEPVGLVYQWPEVWG